MEGRTLRRQLLTLLCALALVLAGAAATPSFASVKPAGSGESQSPPQPSPELLALQSEVLAIPEVVKLDLMLDEAIDSLGVNDSDTYVYDGPATWALPGAPVGDIAEGYLASVILTVEQGPEAAFAIVAQGVESPEIQALYEFIGSPEGVHAVDEYVAFLRNPLVGQQVAQQVEYLLSAGMPPDYLLDSLGRARLDAMPAVFAFGIGGLVSGILTVAAGAVAIACVATACGAVGAIVIGGLTIAAGTVAIIDAVTRDSLPDGVCIAQAQISYYPQGGYLIGYGEVACGNRQSHIGMSASLYENAALSSLATRFCTSTDRCSQSTVGYTYGNAGCWYARAEGNPSNGTPSRPEDQTSPACVPS